MDDPRPELIRYVYGEKELKCPACARCFIVKESDHIELLGYKGFGMVLNEALWETPCLFCGSNVRFLANDGRNIRIDLCAACSKCGIFNVVVGKAESSIRTWKEKTVIFICKACGQDNSHTFKLGRPLISAGMRARQRA